MPAASRFTEHMIRRKFGRFQPNIFTRRPRLDIAVGYTTEVADLYGETLLLMLAELGATWFEDALANSGAPTPVRITGIVDVRDRESNYTSATGNVDDELLLAAASQNYYLRKLRRKTRADFATLMVARGFNAGYAYAWVPHTWWPLGAEYAYSLVHVNDTAMHGIAHECGHNIGCGHVTAGTLAQEIYAHGWCLDVNPGGRPDCTAMVSDDVGGFEGWVQCFSDPDNVHASSGLALGTADNDNTRLLHRNLRWVALWGYVVQVLPP